MPGFYRWPAVGLAPCTCRRSKGSVSAPCAPCVTHRLVYSMVSAWYSGTFVSLSASVYPSKDR